jgi:hypothetical protein
MVRRWTVRLAQVFVAIRSPPPQYPVNSWPGHRWGWGRPEHLLPEQELKRKARDFEVQRFPATLRNPSWSGYCLERDW